MERGPAGGHAQNRESPRRRKTALPDLDSHAIPRSADRGLWQQRLRLGAYAARRSGTPGERQPRCARLGGAMGNIHRGLDLRWPEPKQLAGSTGLVSSAILLDKINRCAKDP